MAATQDDLTACETRAANLAADVVTLKARLEEIREIALKTIYGPDPEPSIWAMQEVLRLAE